MLKVRVVLLLPGGSRVGRAGRLPARGRARTRPISQRPSGPGTTTARPGAAPTRCPAQAPVPADADRARAGRRDRHRPRRARPAAHAGPAADSWTRSPTRPALRSSGSTSSQDLDRARLAAETDRLRSALLTSISHDLRTPLASILGSAAVWPATGIILDDEARRRTARHDPGGGRAPEPLHRQPARHDAAGVRPAPAHSALADLSDVIGAALQRAREDPRRPPGRGRSRSPSCRCCGIDMVLFEQVLFNLLDNAAKYAPAGSVIRLRARRDGEAGADARSSTRASAFRRPTSNGSSTSSIACTAADRRRAGTGPWPCDLPRLRRSHGRHDRRGKPARTGPAPCSPSACRSPAQPCSP